MKIKKLILILPLLLVLFLSSAGCSSRNKYKLTVNDPEGFLIEKLEKSYSAGTKVTVKTEIIDCAELSVYLDGVSLGAKTVIEKDGRYSHWEFYFVMPEHDAVLTFDVLGGDPIDIPDGHFRLTVDDTDAVLMEQLEKSYPAGERVAVKTRIPESGSIKALLDGASLGDYTVIEENGRKYWAFYFVMPEHDSVLSFEITVPPSKPTEVNDGSFYSLGRAYEQGYLTIDDLKSIAYYQNGGNSENEEIIPDGFVPAEKTPLSGETELSIKYSYLDDIKRNSTLMLEEYTVDKVSVNYYGTYGNCVVAMMHGYAEYAQVVGYDTVGGVKLCYGDGNRLAVWIRQDDEAIEENVAFDMGVTYGGDLVLSSLYDLRVESLFLNYGHFARFTRDKSCFPDGEENTTLIAMKEKYTEEYFEQNALIVVKFFSPTWGGAFKNVFLTRRGNKLFLEYEYIYGDSDAICYPALVLEVSKADLQDADILRVNFNK